MFGDLPVQLLITYINLQLSRRKFLKKKVSSGRALLLLAAGATLVVATPDRKTSDHFSLLVTCSSYEWGLGALLPWQEGGPGGGSGSLGVWGRPLVWRAWGIPVAAETSGSYSFS